MNLINKDMQTTFNEVLVKQHCTELYLESNRFTSNGTQLLVEAFQHNIIVELLDLSRNRIQDDRVQYLAAVICMHQHLRNLRLGMNAISDIGAEYLYRFLIENRSIKLLALSLNELTSRRVITLAKTAPHTNLEHYYLDDNQQINDECIDALIGMIRTASSLKAISLSNSGFSSKGKEKLRELVKNKHTSFFVRVNMCLSISRKKTP